MNNEKSSIYQEYSDIQEKNQWVPFYQVGWAAERRDDVSWVSQLLE